MSTKIEYTITSNHAIGERIKALREQLEFDGRPNLSRMDLAEKLHVTCRQLANVERGVTSPSAELVRRLADILGTSCDYLLTGISLENRSAHEITGLCEDSLNRLSLWNEKTPDFISMLDILLRNEGSASLLLRAILLYANATMVKISPLQSSDPQDAIYVDNLSGNTMIKQLSISYISTVLDICKKEWESVLIPAILLEKISKPSDEKLRSRLIYKTSLKDKERLSSLGLKSQIKSLDKDVSTARLIEIGNRMKFNKVRKLLSAELSMEQEP